MPRGRIGTAIVALSILSALVLIALGVWTRKGGVVASSASAKTYREARFEGAELSFTLINKWPEDQAFRWGRAVRSTHMESSSLPSVSKSLVLLDQTEAVLHKGSGKASWWRAFWSEGGAFHRKYGPGQVTFAGANAVLTLPTTAPSVKVEPTKQGGEVIEVLGETMVSGSFDIASVKSPTTLPNITIASILPGSNTLTLQTTPTATMPKPAPTDAAILSVGRNVETRRTPMIVNDRKTVIIAGTLRLSTAPPYSYERYAVPLWMLVVAVLLPVWWAMLLAGVRWNRRRRRRRRGLCAACGYDLRGNPGSGVCPECGAMQGMGTAGIAVG